MRPSRATTISKRSEDGRESCFASARPLARLERRTRSRHRWGRGPRRDRCRGGQPRRSHAVRGKLSTAPRCSYQPLPASAEHKSAAGGIKSRLAVVYHQFRRNCISSKRSFVYHQFRRNCISSNRKESYTRLCRNDILAKGEMISNSFGADDIPSLRLFCSECEETRSNVREACPHEQYDYVSRERGKNN